MRVDLPWWAFLLVITVLLAIDLIVWEAKLFYAWPVRWAWHRLKRAR